MIIFHGEPMTPTPKSGEGSHDTPNPRIDTCNYGNCNDMLYLQVIVISRLHPKKVKLQEPTHLQALGKNKVGR